MYLWPKSSREYEDDPVKLFGVLNGLVNSAPFLFRIHDKIETFVRQTYMAKDENNVRTARSNC